MDVLNYFYRKSEHPCGCLKGEDAYGAGVGLCVLPGRREQDEGAEILPEDL